MTPEQVALIQVSFTKVEPIADVAAGLFYNRLFEIAPALKPLFKGDMADQKRKLMTTLALVVKSLDKLESILPAVQRLGQKHIEYGVKAEHYQPVGAALLWVLEQGLGEVFTPEVEEAWSAAYTTLTQAMTTAAGKVNGT